MKIIYVQCLQSNQFWVEAHYYDIPEDVNPVYPDLCVWMVPGTFDDDGESIW